MYIPPYTRTHDPHTHASNDNRSHSPPMSRRTSPGGHGQHHDSSGSGGSNGSSHDHESGSHSLLQHHRPGSPTDAPRAAAGRRPSPDTVIKAVALTLLGCFALVFVALPSAQPAGILGHLKGSSDKADLGTFAAKDKGGSKSETTRFDYCQAPLSGEEGRLGSSRRRLTLRQLQLVIRHGDRSPINSLTSPAPAFDCTVREPRMAAAARRMKEGFFQVVGLGGTGTLDYLTQALSVVADPEGEEEEKTACFPGQLTERGLRQQLDNGRYLWERYGELLPLEDPAQEVYFRTTYYPRTFQSGAALLLSFLGESPLPSPETLTVYTQEENAKEPLFGTGLIGVSRKKSVDPFEAPAHERGSCEQAFLLGARQEAAFAMDPSVEREFLSQLGLDPSARKGPADLPVADQADPVMGMHCHAMEPLPVQRKTAQRLKAEADRQFCERFVGEEGGREGTRLGMQPFLQEVADRLKAAPKTRLALYSSHDTVLAPLLAALDAYDTHCYWVPYASRVVFELWADEGAEEEGEEEEEAQYVRLLYNGQVVSDRRRHCPDYVPVSYVGGKEGEGEEKEDPTLLPLGCFEEYVKSLGDTCSVTEY